VILADADRGRQGAMEMHNVSLRGIKVDPLAHELATSEGTRPYLDCVIKAYRNNAVGLDAALQVVRDLPLEKRYTWRVFSALKWAFADFEDEYVKLDLPHIPEPIRSEMTKELELRFLQLQMLLKAFHNEQKLKLGIPVTNARRHACKEKGRTS
jgi:hypothetical protein